MKSIPPEITNGVKTLSCFLVQLGAGRAQFFSQRKCCENESFSATKTRCKNDKDGGKTECLASLSSRRQLINGDEISFKGSIYSENHNRKFHTDGSIAKKYQPDLTKDATLLIDNKPHDEWFREQYQTHTQTVEPQQRRGRRM